MKNQSIYRLIYTSHVGSKTIDNSVLYQFQSILEVSQLNNVRYEITGFLIFDSVNFIQILEGSRDVLWKLFQKILKDDRHYNINLLEFVSCEKRQFPDWSMGGCLRTAITDYIFIRHGLFGPIEANDLKSEKLIALAHDLMVANPFKAGAWDGAGPLHRS